MVQVTKHDVGGETIEVCLCMWCRRKADQETAAAQLRSQNKDNTGTDGTFGAP